MGVLSTTQSVSRYCVEGKFESDVMETIKEGLIKNSIPPMESEYDEILAGWTCYEKPYQPDFDKFSFIFGTYFLFSLRIDKKTIPAKLVQKHISIEIDKKLEKSGRQFLSKNEKSEIKDRVTDELIKTVPSVPNIYDILWDYEASNLFFFSTQKAANELFENLFLKSFKLKPIRVFPYTMIEQKSNFTAQQKDQILNLSQIKYSR